MAAGMASQRESFPVPLRVLVVRAYLGPYRGMCRTVGTAVKNWLREVDKMHAHVMVFLGLLVR